MFSSFFYSPPVINNELIIIYCLMREENYNRNSRELKEKPNHWNKMKIEDEREGAKISMLVSNVSFRRRERGKGRHLRGES